MNRRLGATIVAVLGMASAAHTAQAADLPLANPPAAAPTGTFLDFINKDGSLTWNGITLYGTVDMGVAWQSHGVPFDPAFPTGIEYLVSKNSNRALWNPAPNGLSQSNIGLAGKEYIGAGWSFIFNLQAGFDPYSMEVADGLGPMVKNNGVPLDQQTANGDSSRAGQLYNSLGYAGVASDTYGTLTLGRQTNLTLDGVIAYDPMGASYAFSPIGYSGATAGGGNTENARYTTSMKYRVSYDHLRFGAIYQFGGYGLDNASSDAYQFQVGGDFQKLSVDLIYSHVDNAVSAALLTAAQNLLNPGTLAATISDNTSVMVLARYFDGPFKFFGGYEHINYAPPSDPQGSFTGLGGYDFVAANVNNTLFNDGDKVLQVAWTGVKYAVTKDLDATVAYYQFWQNSYGGAHCSNTSSAKCSGTENVVSAMIDWRFAKRFDAYAGIEFSQVNNGMANGYLYSTSIDPTVGVRFQF